MRVVLPVLHRDDSHHRGSRIPDRADDDSARRADTHGAAGAASDASHQAEEHPEEHGDAHDGRRPARRRRHHDPPASAGDDYPRVDAAAGADASPSGDDSRQPASDHDAVGNRVHPAGSERR